MCLIAICIQKKPSREIIHKGWDSNSHGAGIAWVNKDRKAQYVKGLTSADEVYKYVEKLSLPFVIHFRLASAGGKDPLLTHPFEISKGSPLALAGEANKVLIHNGHESDWKKCLAASGVDVDAIKTPLSDTRAIAMIIARHKNSDFLKIASGKFVTVGYDDAEDKNKIRYWGDFDEEDGILYSNTHWKWRSIVYPQGSYKGQGSSSIHGNERYNDDEHDWRGDYYSGGKPTEKKTKDVLDEAAKEADALINGGAIVFSDDYKARRRAWWQKKFKQEDSNAGTKYPPSENKPIVYNIDKPEEKNDQTTLTEEEQQYFGGCGC